MNERARGQRDRQRHRGGEREREGGKEREGGSAVSLSIPPVGSGSPTLTAAHYTTAERSTVSFRNSCHFTAGGKRDE